MRVFLYSTSPPKKRYPPQGPANDHKKAAKENHPLPSVFFNQHILDMKFGHFPIWVKIFHTFHVPSIGGKWIQRVMNPKRERPWTESSVGPAVSDPSWRRCDHTILGHRVGRYVWGMGLSCQAETFSKSLWRLKMTASLAPDKYARRIDFQQC